MCPELLMLVGQPFSTPTPTLARIWPATSLLFFPDEPRAYLKAFEKFKGPPCKIPDPPNSKAVNFKNMWKIVEISEKCQTGWV
jgi:hypothetical protein